ncbi:MAG: VTT domain-containing protein [Patescibacteria group bacterium]
MKRIVKALAIPLILLATLVVFFIIASIFFPTPDALLEGLKYYFALYGYPVLVISAIIESIPLINIYFPGSSIILLAAAFSRQGSLNIYAVIFLTALSFCFTYALNYWIGHAGWHKLFIKFGMGEALEKTKKQVERRGSWWIWISYTHPNLGALTSTAFGILKLPFTPFMIQSVAANIVWATFWGVLMYYSSDGVVEILTARWLVIALLAVVIAVKIIKEVRKSKRSGSPGQARG